MKVLGQLHERLTMLPIQLAPFKRLSHEDPVRLRRSGAVAGALSHRCTNPQ